MKGKKNRNNNQIGLKKNNSNLKSLFSIRKDTYSLSKIDMDCMMTSKQLTVANNLKKHKKATSNMISHNRLISGLARNSNLRDYLNTKRTDQFYQKHHGRQSRMQEKVQVQILSTQVGYILAQIQNRLKSLRGPLLEKPKIAIKSVGNIVGYGVNSRQGLLSPINEERICVITNINKSLIRRKQISFFGIFNGKNGVSKAQYYRDNFHLLLYRDENFFKDMQKAIQKTLIYIQRNFQEDKKQKQLHSDVTFVLSIMMENLIFLVKFGQLKPTVSLNMGEKIYNPFDYNRRIKNNSVSFNIRNPVKYRSQPIIRTIRRTEDMDFLILGSEGLYQNISQKKIGEKTWMKLLQGCPQSMQKGIDMTIESLMSQTFQQLSSKGTSIILILFQNIPKCFLSQKICLPFVDNQKPQQNDLF